MLVVHLLLVSFQPCLPSLFFILLYIGLVKGRGPPTGDSGLPMRDRAYH